jgi:uncharacterized protein YdeI (YjbR/CyaY-like superfamily)
MATTRRKKPSGPRAAGAVKAVLEPTGVRYFRTQALWRMWLERNHARETQLWVGFWRVATGKPSITWPQSVDEALCFGWIDGLRRGLDTERYAIRFTPRTATSLWSRVNLKRFAELNTAGLVRAAGRAARGKWDDSRSSGYSHDTPLSVLDERGLAALRARPRAWRFWEAQTPSYRKVAGHWAVSAKREETRARRLAGLVAACEAGRAIPPLAKLVKVKRAGR